MAAINFLWDGKTKTPAETTTLYSRDASGATFWYRSSTESWTGVGLVYGNSSEAMPTSGVLTSYSYESRVGLFDLKISSLSYSIPADANYEEIISGMIAGPDTWIGNNQNNWFYFSVGGDTYNGGRGTDSIVFPGNKQTWFDILKLKISFQTNQATKILLPSVDTNLDSIERLVFDDVSVALDIAGVGGEAYRIYKAAFNRIPDAEGLGYWIGQMDKGMGLQEVSARFIDSAEFKALYGASPSKANFLTKVYTNVLGRTPDQGGYDWWLNAMNTDSTKTFAKVLADFSESAENQTGTAALVATGIVYEPWGG